MSGAFPAANLIEGAIQIRGGHIDGITDILDFEAFARSDGFGCWAQMVEFWRQEHGAIKEFEGALITWKPIGGQDGI